MPTSVYKGLLQDRALDRLIGTKMTEAAIANKAARTPSGKLSASMLYSPLQWQILKTIGIAGKPYDEYTLRKFERGHNVEEWLLTYMPGVLDKQKLVEYHDAIGYIDALVDTTSYEHSLGIIPHEIKSVSNAKFKRISAQGSPDMGHILQACFYALALTCRHFAIDYVSTDDYRVETYVLPTEKYAKDVTDAIVGYKQAMRDWTEKKVIPAFVAREKWQADIKYCDYPTFVGLDQSAASNLAIKMLGGEK